MALSSEGSHFLGNYVKRNSSVRIWGLAADGKTFTQDATFRSLSRSRAWIEGVEGVIQIGEGIGLQYEGNRARVRVSSVDDQKRNNIVLAVDLVGGQPCPWESLIDLTRTEPLPENRRRYVRHPVSLAVELRSTESGVPIRVSATDACGNGCYLQTMATVGVGTKFIATFYFADRSATCECTVRTRDPGLGMGIEFTGLEPNIKHELRTWLEKHCSIAGASAKASGLRT